MPAKTDDREEQVYDAGSGPRRTAFHFEPPHVPPAAQSTISKERFPDFLGGYAPGEILISSIPFLTLDRHPDTVVRDHGALDREGSTGRFALAAGAEAASEMYQAGCDIADARKALAQIDRKTGERVVQGPNIVVRTGHEQEYADAIRRVSERVLGLVEKRSKEIAGYVAQMDRDLDEKTRTAIGREIRQEIRQHVRSLKPHQRATFLHKASLDVIASVLDAPACLSELSDEEAADLRTLSQFRFFPQIAEQRHAARQLHRKLEAWRYDFARWTSKEIAYHDTPASRAVAKLKGLR